MGKKNKHRKDKLYNFLPEAAGNPFGEAAESSFEDALLLDFEESGFTDTDADFLSDSACQEVGCTSTPFPSWKAEIGKDNADSQSAPSSIPATRQNGNRRMTGDAAYEYDVATHLVSNYPTALYQGIPYIKIDGVDTPLNSRLVGSLIERSMPTIQKQKVSSRNFPYIQTWLQAILDGKERTLVRDPHLILFENGCVNFLTGEFVSASQLREKFFPVRIKASYFPDNPPETPVWNKFLEDCSGGAPEIRQLILEFVGYMLAPCDPDQIILMAPAAGSGKSVAGNFVRELLGFEKTCAIALSNFGKSFEVSQIYGKVANFCLDISSAILSDTTVSTIKRLTGAGDPETINAKYQQPFQYINYAKLVFACNEGGIRLRNPDSGFERRLTVIPFLHSLPRHKMDKQLKEKLWQERDGIVWQAVEALKSLYKRGYTFSYCSEGEKLMRQYMGVAEPSVQGFIDEYCVLSSEERAWTSELYSEYLRYCQESDMEPVGRKRFGQMIYTIPGVRPHKFQKDHIQLQGADGICLKDISNIT